VNRFVRTAFWISILIAVAVVARRLITLASPSQNGPPRMVALDTAFASHTALTLAHILPALAFVLLVPYVLLRRSRTRFPEQLLLALGVVVGLTAYAMSRYSVGGSLERSAVLFFKLKPIRDSSTIRPLPGNARPSRDREEAVQQPMKSPHPSDRRSGPGACLDFQPKSRLLDTRATSEPALASISAWNCFARVRGLDRRR